MGDKIGKVYQDRVAMNKFHDLNNSVDKISFERSWAGWVKDNEMDNNRWLQDIYNRAHIRCAKLNMR